MSDITNAIDLDTIIAKADADYSGTPIKVGEEVVTLRNFLQLPKDVRNEVQAAQVSMGEDDADQAEILSSIIRLVADNSEVAGKLLERVGDNLAYLMQIFKTYNEATQAGEA